MTGLRPARWIARSMLRVGIGAVFGLGAASLLPTPVLAETVVRLRADVWCPYNCDPAGADPGYMIEIARAAFARQGYAVDYRILPWARALRAVRTGEADGAVGAAVHDAIDLVFPGLPLGVSQDVFGSLKSREIKIHTLKNLEQYNLAVIKDYSYSKEVDLYIKKNSANSARIRAFFGDEPLPLIFRYLKAGWIDLMIEDSNVTTHALKKIVDMPPLEFHPAGAPTIVSIGFTPNRPESAALATLLDDATADLRRSGALAKILAKYGVPDWGKPP